MERKYRHIDLEERCQISVWQMQMTTLNDQVKAFAKEAKSLEKQIAGRVDWIMETSNQTIINAYEQKIEQMEQRRLIVIEKSRHKPQNSNTLKELFEL